MINDLGIFHIKQPINIFRFISVELSQETKIYLVIDPFEEIFFRRLRNEPVNVPKGVFFITKSIVGRNNDVFL